METNTFLKATERQNFPKQLLLQGITLAQPELEERLFIANAPNSKKGRANPYLGAALSQLHLTFLCDFSRFSFLHICDLSNNYISNIQALSCCLNLVWLDIHSNHIEEFPDEYFWTGMVSLRILNAHDNPLATLINIKHLSACRQLEILTLYDSPVAVLPFYRHCCVNKIITLRALDGYVVSDDEVIEGFSCPAKFCKFSKRLKVKLVPRLNDGMAGVFAVLRKVNRIQAKFSPCLFIQRVYRGHRIRRKLKAIIRAAKLNPWKMSEADFFKLTAMLSGREVSDETREKFLDPDRLPPIMPPTTPQATQFPADNKLRANAAIPTFSSLRLIFHKLAHSNLLNDSEEVIDSIQAKRMNKRTEEYIREATGQSAVEGKTRDKMKSRQKMTSLLEEKNSEDAVEGILATRKHTASSLELRENIEKQKPNVRFVLLEFRVATSEQINLSQMEVKQLEAQMIKQADVDYHTKNRLDVKNDLADKQDIIHDMKQANMNAVSDRVNAEEHLTQQLACLAAVEKAYHERKVREVRFEKANTILASREATTHALQKQSALVTSAHELAGNEIRTQRHLTHLLLEKLKERDDFDKREMQKRRLEERIARRSKMDSYRACADLRQRFSAISSSVNRYDWGNRQQGMLERARGLVEQVAAGKQAAAIATSDRQRKRIGETTALNQIEIRRAHEAIDAAEEAEMELAKKRVSRVRSERPERYPPQLPGSGSMSIDGIYHASYNPIVAASLSRVDEDREDPLQQALPKEEVVDIRERWKVLAGVPDGRIGLHPITADIG